MVITQEQAESRLESPDNLIVKMRMFDGGRRGSSNISKDTKAMIGTLARLKILPRKDLAELTGVSREEVSLCRNGESSQGVRDAEIYSKIKGNVEEVKEDIKERAVENLLSAMGIIKTKLPDAKLMEASSVAKDQAIILEKISGGRGGAVVATKVVIHDPGVREEGQYATVEVVAGVR